MWSPVEALQASRPRGIYTMGVAYRYVVIAFQANREGLYLVGLDRHVVNAFQANRERLYLVDLDRHVVIAFQANREGLYLVGLDRHVVIAFQANREKQPLGRPRALRCYRLSGEP